MRIVKPFPRRELELSLVIPAYDEAENLPVLMTEIRQALGASPWSYEVLVVDDGSADATSEILTEQAQRDPRVCPLRLERNQGQSAALVAGFRSARGRIVVTLDADLQNDPADIPELVATLESTGADAVSGVRAARHDSRLWRGTADLMAVRWMQKRWIRPVASHKRSVPELKETPAWTSRPSGWSPVSSDRRSSAAVCSSSGSPRSDDAAALSPSRSGT